LDFAFIAQGCKAVSEAMGTAAIEGTPAGLMAKRFRGGDVLGEANPTPERSPGTASPT
jgi:hypothetical protein